ncbi:hypothetical protein ACH196_03905 [Mesorhizobium sp. IMUNJ23232]
MESNGACRMRTTFLAMLAIVSALSGCVTEQSGEAYSPPCGDRAYDAGFCPYPGYRTPVPLW